MRTDLSDPEAWDQIVRLINEPEGEHGFRARVSYLSDVRYEGLTPEELLEAGRRGPYRSFVFFVDGVTLASPEHPVGVLDLLTEPGRVFRVVPSEMWSVENNFRWPTWTLPSSRMPRTATGSFAGSQPDEVAQPATRS